jgi:antitoxin PrlF
MGSGWGKYCLKNQYIPPVPFGNPGGIPHVWRCASMLHWTDMEIGRRVRKQGTQYKRTVMIAIAKVTAKGQTTIPQDVRNALKVTPGDLIAWEVGPDGKATVRRVQAIDLEYLHAYRGL